MNAAMNLVKLLAPALLAFALAGCISFGGGKPPPSLLTLTPAVTAPSGTSVTADPAQAIVVEQPETERILSYAKVPVTVDATDVAYLKDAQWVEPPARLFRSLLAETLRAKTRRLVFEESMPQARQVLSGRLTAFGYDAGRHTVVVRYDAVWQDAKGKLTMRRFEVSEPVAEAKAGPVGQALNQAANEVAGQVAGWIG